MKKMPLPFHARKRRHVPDIIFSIGLLVHTGCLEAADPRDGEAAEASDALDKSALFVNHGRLVPDFTFQVTANKARAHQWRLDTDEALAVPFIVRRVDDVPRIAYLRVYRLTAAGRQEVSPELGARDIVNESPARLINLAPGAYEFELTRPKAIAADFLVSLGELDDDGQAAAMPDYLFDLLASPDVKAEDRHEAPIGAALSAQHAAWRAEVIAAHGRTEPTAFATTVIGLRYGGFRLDAVSLDNEATDDGSGLIRLGGLYLTDLVGLSDPTDDAAPVLLSLFDDVGYFFAPPDAP